ncbi:hypothetical protein [Streptomyces zingiberis]|uniref:hypothetical protein n=1 Tax=Streptomyces zingiberis TaxID=2053010 RepID=UPI002892F5CB|nr:hypothetical protein [Streptomyces zingiberis]
MTTTTETSIDPLPAEPAEPLAASRWAAFRGLDAWSTAAPIRLAGYDDDPAESHILRGID